MRVLLYLAAAIAVAWFVAVGIVSDGASHCADGWISPSRGQGRCSWHGGAATQSEVKAVNAVFTVISLCWLAGYFYVSWKNSKQDEIDREKAQEAFELEREKTHPLCPECSVFMVPRVARRGPHKGSKFWGCRNYPACIRIVQLEEAKFYLKRRKNDA